MKSVTEKQLQESERSVENDSRYGYEADIIKKCLKKFPSNDNPENIALKISLIDMTNSTNLNKFLGKVNLKDLIDKIIKCNFDDRVSKGDISLVPELAKNEINLFSFFSKYCLYHNFYVYKRDDFVIFDSVMKEHMGDYILEYKYCEKIYESSKIKNCIDKMRKNYDYDGYRTLIDSILENNNIKLINKRRKFDWFVWYNNR